MDRVAPVSTTDTKRISGRMALSISKCRNLNNLDAVYFKLNDKRTPTAQKHWAYREQEDIIGAWIGISSYIKRQVTWIP